MKRMLNIKRRLSSKKKSLKPNRRIFKRIQNKQKKYQIIDSPYNSSQFLIENNSSPFEDDDSEDSYEPKPIILANEFLLCDDEYSKDFRKMSSFSTQNESIIMDTHFKTEKELYL